MRTIDTHFFIVEEGEGNDPPADVTLGMFAPPQNGSIAIIASIIEGAGAGDLVVYGGTTTLPLDDPAGAISGGEVVQIGTAALSGATPVLAFTDPAIPNTWPGLLFSLEGWSDEAVVRVQVVGLDTYHGPIEHSDFTGIYYVTESEWDAIKPGEDGGLYAVYPNPTP